MAPFAPRFLRALRFGTCAAISLPEDGVFEMPPELHPEEAAHARTLARARRTTWVGGRLALRAALSALATAGEAPGEGRGALDVPLLPTPRGGPALPPGHAGSISHKRVIAVALAARVAGAPPATLGIDVELPRPSRYDIGPRVLTPGELDELRSLDERARALEVLRRFAAKEAIYKALDPWVGRYVAFHEIALSGLPGAPLGPLETRLTLAGGEGPFFVEVEDASDGALILIAARVAPLS